MDSRKIPESALSPEFIRVAYDKHGNPIDVRPVDMKVTEANGEKKPKEAMPKTIPQPIEEWLVVISKNIISLRRDLANTQNIYNQIVQEVRQLTPQVDFTPIDNSIDAINHRIDDVLQKMQTTNQEAADQKMLYKILSDQINVTNEIIASLAKEFSHQQTIGIELGQKIEMLNEQVNGSFINIKAILKEIDSGTNNQKFNDLDGKIAAMHRQLATSIERTEGNIVALNGIMDEIRSKIDNMEVSNFEIQVAVQNSLKEFADNFEKTSYKARNQMENSLNSTKQELMQAIEQNKIDREALIQEIVDRTVKRMRKLAKTPKVEVKIKVKKRKYRVRKIRKAKIKKMRKINRNILAKKLLKTDIATYPSALIVTERKTQRIGRAVFDVAKVMNKNVLMIMQNKMSESDGFEPVTYDAMSNSDAIFIVTKKNMKKNFSLKTLVATKPVFVVNQKMKFSEMKN